MNGLGIFTMTAKSFGFCSKKEKNKSKQKDFAMCMVESER